MRAVASFLGRHKTVTVTQSSKPLNVALNHTLENVAFARSRAVRCATPVSTVWKSPSTEIENLKNEKCETCTQFTTSAIHVILTTMNRMVMATSCPMMHLVCPYFAENCPLTLSTMGIACNSSSKHMPGSDSFFLDFTCLCHCCSTIGT